MKQSGLWGNDEVPKEGWTCLGIEDLGAGNFEVCQMCCSQDIRFVHIMDHVDYGEVVRSGCVCAGKMESDPEAAENRDRLARSKAASRERLRARICDLSKWKRSQKGNYYRTIYDDLYTIFKTEYGWKLVVDGKFGERCYPRPEIVAEHVYRYFAK